MTREEAWLMIFIAKAGQLELKEAADYATKALSEYDRLFPTSDKR